MSSCNHYLALGYKNYFEEQDNNAELLTKDDIALINERFGEKNDLILELFYFCPSCGVLLIKNIVSGIGGG